MLTKIQSYNSAFCGSNITKLRNKNQLNIKRAVGHMRDLAALKDLSDSNINLLKNVLINDIQSANALFATIHGIKPAALITSYIGRLDYLNNIPNFDFIHERACGYDNSFIINKEKVIKIIEKNKRIFTSRLNISTETSNDEVYRITKNNLFSQKYHDLTGITLGYPPIDCMIFQLGLEIPVEMKKHRQYFSHMLLQKLYAPDSIYKYLNKKTFNELDKAIRSIKKPHKSPYVSHIYMQYTGKNKEIAAKDEKYLLLNYRQLLSDS